MVNATARESKARFQIVRLQIRHLVENLCGVQARRKKIENVADSNAHAADTRSAAALLRVERDAVEQGSHEVRLEMSADPARREMIAVRERARGASRGLRLRQTIPLLGLNVWHPG